MNATLYVPIGTMEAYKATEGWKDFKNIVEGTPTGITSVTSDKETTNITGRIALILQIPSFVTDFFRYANLRITEIMRTKQKCEPNSADMSL